MNKHLAFKAALILLLSVGPTAACDPEEMINELRAQCRDAVTSALALVEPVKSALSSTERGLVETRINEATALCNSDRYGDGYTAAAKLSRFVGHVEARKGIAPAL